MALQWERELHLYIIWIWYSLLGFDITAHFKTIIVLCQKQNPRVS